MRIQLVACLFLAGAARGAGLLPEVEPTLLRLYELDAPYRVEVPVHEAVDPGGAPLLGELPEGPLHPSYRATYELCQRLDPYDADDRELPEQVFRDYLEGLRDMAPIREALRVTRRSLDDMLRIWLRRGRGFEHVICGESGGKGGWKLGGYHFWYMHHRYEREGRARYLGADYGSRPGALEAGLADPGIVTGRMSWDPDGPGGRDPLGKVPRGGFTVGNSVATMLAAGHIAFYGALRNPIEANLSGVAYPWTFYRRWEDGASSVRSLWPRFRARP